MRLGTKNVLVPSMAFMRYEIEAGIYRCWIYSDTFAHSKGVFLRPRRIERLYSTPILCDRSQLLAIEKGLIEAVSVASVASNYPNDPSIFALCFVNIDFQENTRFGSAHFVTDLILNRSRKRARIVIHRICMQKLHIETAHTSATEWKLFHIFICFALNLLMWMWIGPARYK